MTNLPKLKCRQKFGQTYCYYENKLRGTAKEYIDPEEPFDPIPIPKKKKDADRDRIKKLLAGAGAGAGGTLATAGFTAYQMNEFIKAGHLDKAVSIGETIEQGGHTDEEMEALEDSMNKVFEKAGEAGGKAFKGIYGAGGTKWLKKLQRIKESGSNEINELFDKKWRGSKRAEPGVATRRPVDDAEVAFNEMDDEFQPTANRPIARSQSTRLRRPVDDTNLEFSRMDTELQPTANTPLPRPRMPFDTPKGRAIRALMQEKRNVNSSSVFEGNRIAEKSMDYHKSYKKVLEKHNLTPDELDGAMAGEEEAAQMASRAAVEESSGMAGVGGAVGAIIGGGIIAGTLYEQFKGQKNSDFKGGRSERAAVDAVQTAGSFVPQSYSGATDLVSAGVEAMYGDKHAAHQSIERLNPMNYPFGDMVHGHWKQAGRDLRREITGMFHHHHQDPEQPSYTPINLTSTNAAQPSGAVYV